MPELSLPLPESLNHHQAPLQMTPEQDCGSWRSPLGPGSVAETPSLPSSFRGCTCPHREGL